jgi:hypothetical protein
MVHYTHNRNLVHKVGNQWFSHNKQGHSNSHYSLVPSLAHQAPTLQSKALVKRHRSSFGCYNDINIIHNRIHAIQLSCPCSQQYENIPTHLRHIIGPCPSPPQCFQSINHNTNIRSGSDGSVLHCQGFQGWLITNMDNNFLIGGAGVTDGCVDDFSSYRAENCSNIATFAVFTRIRKLYVFLPPTIEHVCNNQSAITAK